MPTSPPAEPIRLYRSVFSGHAHKIELFLCLLGLPMQKIDVDLAAGAHRTPEFLAKNAYGQIPVIEDGDVTLADSNAILVYLAMRYGAEHWLPRDALGAATVQRFLSIAAGDLYNGPNAARLVQVFGAPRDYSAACDAAKRLFGVLEPLLAKQAFLAGAAPTIADIANYTYIAHAPEGGISLQPYAQIRGWQQRIEALPGFVPMRASKLPAAPPA
jgi:glutathione S-transferase